MDKDTEIFKGKSFAKLAEDIYSTSKKKETQINLLIAELKPLISTRKKKEIIRTLKNSFIIKLFKNSILVSIIIDLL